MITYFVRLFTHSVCVYVKHLYVKMRTETKIKTNAKVAVFCIQANDSTLG